MLTKSRTYISQKQTNKQTNKHRKQNKTKTKQNKTKKKKKKRCLTYTYSRLKKKKKKKTVFVFWAMCFDLTLHLFSYRISTWYIIQVFLFFNHALKVLLDKKCEKAQMILFIVSKTYGFKTESFLCELFKMLYL